MSVINDTYQQRPPLALHANRALWFCPSHYLLVSELALTIAPQDVVKVVKIVCICVVRVGGVPAIVLANIVPACVAVERWRGE